MAVTHVQHELGVGVDQLDQREQEALVAARVQVRGFLFELQAGRHLPFEGQTLWEEPGGGGGVSVCDRTRPSTACAWYSPASCAAGRAWRRLERRGSGCRRT